MDRPRPPLIEIVIKPNSKADRERLSTALVRMTGEDSSLVASQDRETGQTILAGADEEHLASALDVLRRKYGVEAEIGAPQVAYRERLKGRIEIEYTHKKRTGAGSQFARVKVLFGPNERGSDNSLTSDIGEGTMPEEFVSAIEAGIRDVLQSGVVAGYPIVDTKAKVLDGAFHDADSSAPAFEIAARAATREGLQKGGCELLEPIMDVEVTTPMEYAGDVLADLRALLAEGARRDDGAEATVVYAIVPLVNLFGYATHLRSLTRGGARHALKFSHYAPVRPSGGGTWK